MGWLEIAVAMVPLVVLLVEVYNRWFSLEAKKKAKALEQAKKQAVDSAKHKRAVSERSSKNASSNDARKKARYPQADSS